MTPRKTYLDGMRILASFCVIYNHTFGYAFFDEAGFGALLKQFAFFLCKPAAPLFFMISGALLLPRVDTYRKVFSRFLRMLLVLALMCAFYLAVSCIRTGEAFRLGDLLNAIWFLEPPGSNAYWYLYCYLGLLLALPALQRLTARLTRKDYRYYFLVAALVVCVLPVTQHLWKQPPYKINLAVSLFYPYIVMMLLGVYLDRYAVLSRRGMLAAGVGILLFTAASVALTHLDARAFQPNGCLYYDDRTLLPIMGASACLFYLCKSLLTLAPPAPWVQRCITTAGRWAFCVYLFGDYFITLLTPVREWLGQNLPEYGGLLLSAVLAYACAMLLSALLTRVPGLRKLL